MVTAMTDLVSTEQPVYIGIVHAERPDLAEYVAKLLEEKYTVREQISLLSGQSSGVNTARTIGFVATPVQE